MAKNASLNHDDATQSLNIRATLCDSTVKDGRVEDKGKERLQYTRVARLRFSHDRPPVRMLDLAYLVC